MIIVSRIIHVKVDRRLNVTNKFKYQRRISSRLAIVMFRGTPCKLWIRPKISAISGKLWICPKILEISGKFSYYESVPKY